jgi:hypothetical protein
MPRLLARDLHLANPASMAEQGAGQRCQRTHRNRTAAIAAAAHRAPLLRLEQPQLLTAACDGRHNNWACSAAQLVRSAAGTGHTATGQWPAAAARRRAAAHPDGQHGHWTTMLPTVAWQMQGHWKQQPVEGQGKAGAVLAPAEQNRPYPLEAVLDVGGSRMAVSGTLTRPASLTSLDLQLSLSGPSMARLCADRRAAAGNPPFSTSGHLHGELGAHASRWHYQNFIGGGPVRYRRQSGIPHGTALHVRN